MGGAEGALAKALKNAYPRTYVLCLDKDPELIKEEEKRWEKIEFVCADFLDFKAEGVLIWWFLPTLTTGLMGSG
ncbi:hypothetical protein SAMN06265353_1319 [Hydrogenobacter hydrogenophilus]|uniref:O-methyltransferase domain-containing protein n=1 Tax=Hydrogenobacter hydrogenophilus TaxID=35835 RepID=A0A285P162_9AQUI|nr:class I SAM-dependent methyltransferase [Hydrogenobacter hydrogenophilus]SNZ15198.1 hypothetical protein SAMN06265353_1319 [Hydrogenobacter hydrogenophilus]